MLPEDVDSSRLRDCKRYLQLIAETKEVACFLFTQIVCSDFRFWVAAVFIHLHGLDYAHV